MKISVETKSVYGQIKVYPACHFSAMFAEIAGTKTLSAANIATIRKLGYAVIDVTPSRIAA
jgi:hypothetical protein